MTKEEEQLLLIDLCEKFPFGVKVKINGVMSNPPGCELIGILGKAKTVYVHLIPASIPIEEVKPYLRPLDSMNNEEKRELFKLCEYYEQEDWERKITEVYGIEIASRFSLSYDTDFKLWGIDMKPIDWLNSHYFDYRGLIKKGLALEAPENMYQ